MKGKGDDMIDVLIIERLKQRDETALEDIKKRYGDTCYKTAFTILKSREDAEEVCADTLLAVWNNIPPDCPENLGGYVYKICRFKANEKYRKNTRQMRNSAMTVSVEELGACIAGADTETEFSEKELSRMIERFLSFESEQNRNIFICRYFYNMKYGEIAKRYGLGLSKVKMSVKRTKAKLKEFLAQEGY